jgi:hypothetical protein
MNYILVGNGSSVLEKKRGELVDSFDRVVRFNSYQINEYEEFVGSKTTDWFVVRNFSDQNFRMKHRYLSATFHSWEWNADKCQTWIAMKDRISADSVKKTNESIIKEMQRFNDDSEYYAFSTGAIAVWQTLKVADQISVIGFDWWEKEKHHYADNEPRGILHKPEKEFSFFKKLGERINFL